MSSRYKQLSDASQGVHFSKALFGSSERSRMFAYPERITSFNAGDIVPIYCREILPEEELSLDVNFVIRQTTMLTPTMGKMHVDIFAYWVPNRIVNQSWKAVEGENLSGSWTANQVSLAPLKVDSTGTTQIPVGSVADYYDFPTQMPLPNSVLSLCHDLKFRGYVMIYNEHFRDQNYQPPIPFSTLNVYQGFLDPAGSLVTLDGHPNQSSALVISPSTVPDGDFGAGSVAQALYGSGAPGGSGNTNIRPAASSRRFRATSKPLKANKLHDYFTSVLPSPQKSPSTVLAPVEGSFGNIPIITSSTERTVSTTDPGLYWRSLSGTTVTGTLASIAPNGSVPGGTSSMGTPGSAQPQVVPSNLVTDSVSAANLGIDLSDIRMAAAIQQVYEVLARGGSRYRSILSSFFGAEYDEAFCDVPVELGRISRDLELYQTAQTSASEVGGSPQGNLAGFGYTATGGHLFSHRFVEHGYLHVFAVVRHRNIYASYFPRDNFRRNMLDFYLPQLANISEQPVYTREINPFADNPNNGFGFQEAWAEYRFEPDTVTGFMRPMPEDVESFSIWNYADDFDSTLQISDGNWLVSNSEEVLNRSLAVTSSLAPQFKASFKFTVDKTLPMPSYSVPGLDIL